MAYYIVNDDQNIKYKLELKGSGTLPSIDVTNHEFPIIDVFTKKDSVFDILKSGGNEDLRI